MSSHAGLARKASVFGTRGRGGFDGSTDVELTDAEHYVVVTTTGDIEVLPYRNTSGNTITFVGAPVGFVPPFRVKTVLAAGTDAVFATVEP